MSIWSGIATYLLIGFALAYLMLYSVSKIKEEDVPKSYMHMFTNIGKLNNEEYITYVIIIFALLWPMLTVIAIADVLKRK